MTESFVRRPSSLIGDNDYLQTIIQEGYSLDADFGMEWPSDALLSTSDRADAFSRGFYGREFLVRRYAWAIPNDPALDAVAALSPIVEVGAGSGYWAKLLRDRGAHVTPYDLDPYPLFNKYITRAYVPISKGNAASALRHGRENWTLFLCWPPYQSPMAEQSLALHRGEHVAYIGEGPWGCTGTERFYELLEARYEVVETVEIPRWVGMHDELEIWRRK